MKNRKKLAHLHISDYCNNKYTLICNLINGESIKYVLFSGWGSSGMPNSLSNLQCDLPLYPDVDETQDMFVDRIVDIINEKSVKKVDKRLPLKIEFA